MVSVVLMGGHGRDYQTFRSATWKDWQQPVIDEYNKLKSLGYKKINLAVNNKYIFEKEYAIT